MHYDKNIAALLFGISDNLNQYNAEFGLLTPSQTDRKVEVLIKKFKNYNGKFVNGKALTEREIKELQRMKKSTESLIYEKRFD